MKTGNAKLRTEHILCHTFRLAAAWFEKQRPYQRIVLQFMLNTQRSDMFLKPKPLLRISTDPEALLVPKQGLQPRPPRRKKFATPKTLSKALSMNSFPQLQLVTCVTAKP